MTAKQKRRSRIGKKTRKLVCSSCAQQAEVDSREMNLAARPRCPSCGGPLNYEHLAGVQPKKPDPKTNPPGPQLTSAEKRAAKRERRRARVRAAMLGRLEKTEPRLANDVRRDIRYCEDWVIQTAKAFVRELNYSGSVHGQKLAEMKEAVAALNAMT